jgi:hypothetical protein
MSTFYLYGHVTPLSDQSGIKKRSERGMGKMEKTHPYFYEFCREKLNQQGKFKGLYNHHGPKGEGEASDNPPGLLASVRICVVFNLWVERVLGVLGWTGAKPQKLDGVLFEDQRAHFWPNVDLLEVGEPAVGGEQGVVAAEEHFVFKQGVGILDEL